MNPALLRQASRPERYVRFDPAEIETSISERFEKQAALYPDHLAFDDDLSRSMTYAELNESANRVAAHLVDREGEQPGKATAILFEQSAEALIAAVGLLKAGRMIVALDPTYPADRNRLMLEDSGARILLTERQHLAMAAGFSPPVDQILAIEDIVERSGDEENPPILFPSDTYSHLIYTSGSTGRPKGVIHTHRTLLHLHCYANHDYGFSPQDRNAMLASMSYGNIMMQLYNALLNGGTAIPFNLRSRPIGDMPDWLRRHRISYISFIPSTFRQLFRYLGDDDRFPDLRILALGGESIRPDDIAAYRRWFGQSTLSLSFGTSEALWVTQCFADSHSDIDAQAIPAGYAFGEQDVMLVDEDGQPAPEGEIGTLMVRSAYLTPGYWQRPELNAVTFLAGTEQSALRMYDTGDVAQREPDGLIVHRGRKDYQIKVRGFRVEAGEVESALSEREDIAQAVIILAESRQGIGNLAAYVVVEGDSAPTPAVLREWLAEKLPAYMVPKYFVVLDALPRTISGKIDRKALPAPEQIRPTLATAYRAPETPLEMAVAAIWAEAFGIERVGLDDNFLELGGHSLLATQIVSDVRHKLANDVAIARMFETETVAELAALIEAGHPNAGKAIPRKGITQVARGDHKKKLHTSGTIHDNEFKETKPLA